MDCFSAFVLFVQCVSGVPGDIKFVKVPFFNIGLCFVKVGFRLDYAPSSSYFVFLFDFTFLNGTLSPACQNVCSPEMAFRILAFRLIRLLK